jgi:hypothetical protein
MHHENHNNAETKDEEKCLNGANDKIVNDVKNSIKNKRDINEITSLFLLHKYISSFKKNNLKNKEVGEKSDFSIDNADDDGYGMLGIHNDELEWSEEDDFSENSFESFRDENNNCILSDSLFNLSHHSTPHSHHSPSISSFSSSLHSSSSYSYDFSYSPSHSNYSSDIFKVSSLPTCDNQNDNLINADKHTKYNRNTSCGKKKFNKWYKKNNWSKMKKIYKKFQNKLFLEDKIGKLKIGKSSSSDNFNSSFKNTSKNGQSEMITSTSAISLSSLSTKKKIRRGRLLKRENDDFDDI